MRYLVFIALILAGCDSRHCGSGGSTPAAGADLIAMGYAYCRYGGIALVLGGALYAVLRWGAAGNPLALAVAWLGGAIVPEVIAIAGAGAIVLGLTFIWLGHYFAWVGGAALVALLGWGWYRRKHLVDWLRHWLGTRKATP